MTTAIRNAAPCALETQGGLTPVCVYVAGSGRNGSTLLGLHLGKHRDIFFAGELTHIWRRGYINDELCGCGEPFSRCDFWRAVTRTAFGKLSVPQVRRVSLLRDRVSSYWRIPSLAMGLPQRSAKAELEYSATYQALLRAISKVSGARVIVDSSKSPTGLAVLPRAGTIPLRVIHLVRDCKAVVFSWKRERRRPEIHWKNQLMPRYGALKTALGWRLFNSAIVRLSRPMGPSYRVLRYEDLVGAFPETLASVYDWLGCAAVGDLRGNDYVAHTVSGNPCRFDTATREIRIDDEWRVRMSAFDRLVVALLCGGPQRLYGYGRKQFMHANAWIGPSLPPRSALEPAMERRS